MVRHSAIYAKNSLPHTYDEGKYRWLYAWKVIFG